MSELSPAAKAVMDATDYPEDWATRIRVAAALRAAATGLLVYQLDDPMMKTVLVVDADDLLAIAAELEAHQ